MSCDISISNPIITINHLYRATNKLYVFIGNDLEDGLYRIFCKIEEGKSLTTNEEKMLKDNFKDYYKKWLDTKIPIRFIQDYIRIDDTLSTIRQKIFIYLSEPKKQYYITEKGQELWLEYEEKYQILGYRFVDKITAQELAVIPATHSEIKIDEEFVDKYEYFSTDPILDDMIDISDMAQQTIYLTWIDDIIERLKKHDIKEVSEKLVNGYIKKHWPDINLDIKMADIAKQYEFLKRKLARDNEIINYVNDVEIDGKKFADCAIIYIIIYANYDTVPKENIDLLKVFNFLRKLLSADIPFIQYRDPSWEKPYSATYEKALKDRVIDKSKIVSWLGLKKDPATGDVMTAKGINIKKLIYTSEVDGTPHYGTIKIHANGRIEMMFSFETEYGATIKDVVKNVGEVAELINKINKIDLVGDIGSNENIKDKFDLPGMRYVDAEDRLVMKSNTKITYINSVSKYLFEKQFNIGDLYNFSKLFTPFITYKIDATETTRFTLVYKRVSNFVNMSEIYKFINEQYQYGVSEYAIITEIANKFGKSAHDATLLYSDYLKRFGGHDKQNLMKQRGITINVVFTTKNIMVYGAPSFLTMVKSNNFIRAMLAMYENLAVYKKEPIFRRLLLTSEEYIKTNKNDSLAVAADINMANMENVANIGKNMNIGNGKNVNFDVDVTKYLDEIERQEKKDKVALGEAEADAENMVNGTGKAVEGKAEGYYDNLAKDSEIESQILTTCEDKLPEADTCKDICNDRNYFLRRLQRHDPKLFNYNVTFGKYGKYSKICAANIDSQPVVMKTNPETDSRVARDSFTYAIRYGSESNNQNYYLCPKVWCPICQIPIAIASVKNIRKKMTVKGRCTIGTCPNGNHEVYVKTEGHFSDKGLERGLYAGFSKSRHPDGHCLPCCFANPQNDPKFAGYPAFKKCLGEDVQIEEGEDRYKYILSSTTVLATGRYGLLSVDLSRLFDTHCEQGVIGQSCWLRRGVEYVENLTFLTAIIDIVTGDDTGAGTITIGKFIRYLVDKLTPKIFKSLNNGTLPLLFGDLENFKKFLLAEGKNVIDERYLWDFLSRPDILYEEGVNIVIMTETTILCPVGFVAREFYNVNRRTVFLIKYPKHYVPIYYVKYDAGNIGVQKTFSAMVKTVSNIISIAQNNCVDTIGIDWKRILKDNERKLAISYDMEASRELTLKQTLNNLKEAEVPVVIKAQIIDHYHKTVGLLLSPGIYLPVKPSAILMDFPEMMADTVPAADYSALKAGIKKLGYGFSYKVLSTDGKKIIAVILNNNRILPVRPNNNIAVDNIPVKSNITYYPNADRMIYENRVENNGRRKMVGKMEYETESFMRIKFELAKYLKHSKKALDELREILLPGGAEIDGGDGESGDEKKAELLSLISPIFRKIISTKKRTIDFSAYTTPNVRLLCQKNCKDPHCINVAGECKLHIFERNLITGKDNLEIYMDMLIEELLKNRMKRDEILGDKVNYIIDKKKLEPVSGEILFFGKLQDDLSFINEIYDKDKHIYIRDIDIFDTAEPKYYGINKEYMTMDVSMNDTARLEPISIYWNKILGDDYMVYKIRDGNLFTSTARGLNYLLDKEQNGGAGEGKMTAIKVKRQLVEYDVSVDLMEYIARELGLVCKSPLGLKIDIGSDGSGGGDMLLKLYKTFEPHIYKNINSIEELRSYILSSGYDGTLVDIYILAAIYKINIAILDKRISTKGSGLGIRLIKRYQNVENKNKDNGNVNVNGAETGDKYMLLYSFIIRDRTIYEIIENKGRYIFTLANLNDRMKTIINEYEEYRIKNANMNGINGENEPKKKKIKIKKIIKRKVATGVNKKKTIKIRVKKR